MLFNKLALGLIRAAHVHSSAPDRHVGTDSDHTGNDSDEDFSPPKRNRAAYFSRGKGRQHRLHPQNHVVEPMDKAKRCLVCVSGLTRRRCRRCKVPLCNFSKRDCFSIFHSDAWPARSGGTNSVNSGGSRGGGRDNT